MSDTNQWEKLNLQYSALKPEPHIYKASCLAYRGLAIDYESSYGPLFGYWRSKNRGKGGHEQSNFGSIWEYKKH